MDMKQKLSLVIASALPVLALSAYLLVAPAKARATSCPTGEVASPCGIGGTGCQSGSGTCYSNGTNGIYVFCRTENGPPNTGPGTCHDGCVTCEYGEN
jgi:hypothetical protein